MTKNIHNLKIFIKKKLLNDFNISKPVLLYLNMIEKKDLYKNLLSRDLQPHEGMDL